MKTICILILLLSAQQVHAGKVAEFFSEGVFGVKWGSTLEEVKQVFPYGTVKTEAGTTSYIIKDGRTPFKIPRKPDNTITYAFNTEGRTSYVSIQFPYSDIEDFVKLLATLETCYRRR